MTKCLSLAVVIALAVAVAAGGCGADDKAAYKKGFRGLYRDIADLRENVSDGIEHAGEGSDTKLGEDFDDLADRAREVTRTAGELEPPAEFERDQRDLLAALRAVEGDLRDIVDASTSHDGQKAAGATAELTSDGEEVDKTADGIAADLDLPVRKAVKDARDADTGGRITPVFRDPQSESESQAKEILEVGGLPQLAERFTKEFNVPTDITIVGEPGDEGPHYDPTDHSVHFSYGFADYVGGVLQKLGLKDEKLGETWAAINSFILVHELGHSFIDVFDLPITGREEDAADQLATVFMTDFVRGGDEYAFDAANFFRLIDDTSAYEESDFWDEHSLNAQRAYDIVCLVAGSSEENFKAVADQKIIGADRLQRCPSEYQQKTSAWQRLLSPYEKG